MKINQQNIDPDGPQSQTHLVMRCICILLHKFDYGWTNQKTNPVSEQEMKALKWLVINGY